MAEREAFSSVLPANFLGYFEFSNWSDEDFVGKWGGKEYLYPSLKMTKMFIENATPLEVQNIRKKFAKELASREFFKSDKGKALEATEKNPDGSARFNSFHQARQYSEDDLKDGIQRCLNPLPIGEALVADAPKEDLESRLSRTPKGKLRTRVLEDGESLVEQAKGSTAVE